MRMEYPREFIELIDNPKWENEFIGYGNPNAEILIIGQEAACEEFSEDWKKFYGRNHNQWYRTIHEGLTFHHYNDESKEYRFPEYFNPLYPFYKQYLSTTSKTWYWYQRLIDNVYMHKREGRRGIIDFFEHAFITELNNHTRKNHKVKQDVEKNIRDRFDFMKETHLFWSRFKFVIIAAGPYADAIHSVEGLKESIFGNAHIETSYQLSRYYAKQEVDRLAPILKDFFCK